MTHIKSKKAMGGRAMSTNPMDYDSDVDYYKAIGDPRGNEDDDSDDTASQMTRTQQNKSKKLVNKLTANRKMFDVAKASGKTAESEKQLGRLQRRGESNRLRNFTEHAEKRGASEKAASHRKEWSEKIGKGKVAPFKAGGKVKSNW